MSTLRKWSPAVLALVAALLSIVAWPRLPERVPIHFNAEGVPDNWGSRAAGALLMPVVMLGMLLFLRALPAVDPRGENWRRMQATIDATIWGTLAALLAIHAAVLAYAVGLPVNISTVATMAVGGLFIVLGAVLPGARPNWFVGVRTPWTLSSDRVWERTHRVAGRLMLVGGLLLLGAPLLPPATATHLLLAVAIGVGVISVGYSYLAWRQEQSP